MSVVSLHKPSAFGVHSLNTYYLLFLRVQILHSHFFSFFPFYHLNRNITIKLKWHFLAGFDTLVLKVLSDGFCLTENTNILNFISNTPPQKPVLSDGFSAETPKKHKIFFSAQAFLCNALVFMMFRFFAFIRFSPFSVSFHPFRLLISGLNDPNNSLRRHSIHLPYASFISPFIYICSIGQRCFLF